MVKKVYSNLFNWLIIKINATLSLGDDTSRAKCQINVLDIFGFESFELNSFEQLCINYCNEKLQSHFNEHIFKLEQDEYKAQGVIVANTAFKDNQPCLDMLELRNVGVFSMLDEEISVPKGSDVGFLSKVLDRYVTKVISKLFIFLTLCLFSLRYFREIMSNGATSPTLLLTSIPLLIGKASEREEAKTIRQARSRFFYCSSLCR
jgi:myosin heavy subunit